MNASTQPDLLILSAISQEFGYLVDHGRAAECAGLFAEDARLVFGPGSPKPGMLEGMEAIRAFFIAREAQTQVTTRHVATNFRLSADAGQTVLESILSVFRSDDSTREPVVSVVADVRELFVCSDAGAWSIQERVTSPIFIHSANQ